MVVNRTEELKRRHLAHVWQAFGVPGVEPDLIFERGSGVKLIDTDGKEYIDTGSFANCTSLGYGRQELIDAAYEQLKKLTYMATFFGCSNIPAIEYAEALAKFTPRGINRFWFCDMGSIATEGSLKVARAYWHFKGKSTKIKTICLMEGYNGSTLALAGLLPDYELRAPFGPEMAGIIRIPNYNCYRCHLEHKYPDCDMACARYVEKVIDEEGEDSIAAFIAEPVHGYGGSITPPPEYWPIVREICSRRNILMIDDEVMTGFCRTGKNFALDNWNVVPDIMAMGKGITSATLPFAVVGVSDKVWDVVADKPLFIGSTTSGHPVTCAVAKAALDIYIKEGICEHVTKVGNHIRERLEKEFLPLPHVGNVGGLGLMQAIEIVADKQSKGRFPSELDVMRKVILPQCLERGLLPRVYSTQRHDRLCIQPPLIISEDEADTILDRMYPIIAGLNNLKVK